MSEEAPARASDVKLDANTVGLGLLLVGMAGIATWDQWAIWSTKDDYTFGYLVPIFSGYVLWDRWANIRAYLTGQQSPISPPASPVLLRIIAAMGYLSLLMFGFGGAGRAIFGTGVIPTLLIAFGLVGSAWTFTFLSVRGPDQTEATAHARWQAVGLMIFPAGVWIISGPFLYLVDNQIKGELLSNVTDIVSGILRVTDHVIRVNGNTIIFANGDGVGIADACSGIRSLSACVFAGAFLGATFLEGGFPGALLRRTGMILLSGLIAILLNIGRNTFLAFYALNHGSRSIDRDWSGIEHGQPNFSTFGSIHDLAGNVAMGLALLALLACLPLINRIGRGARSPSSVL